MHQNHYRNVPFNIQDLENTALIIPSHKTAIYAVLYTPPCCPSGLHTDSEQSEDSPSKVLAVWVESEDSPSSVQVLVKFWP